MLCISKIIAKINILNKIFSYIGQHTISILSFHLLAFKLVTCFQVIIYSKPAYCLAAFPILYKNNLWWLLYCIAGVCIPLLLTFFCEKLKNLKISSI